MRLHLHKHAQQHAFPPRLSAAAPLRYTSPRLAKKAGISPA